MNTLSSSIKTFELPPSAALRRGRVHHPVGPFAADLLPSRTTFASGAYPDRLRLGLLTALQDETGGSAVELVHPDYKRQPIELSPRNDSHFSVARPVLFELFACPPVQGLALFDHAGEIVAAGALQGRSTSRFPASRFEFAIHKILVGRCVSAEGLS